MTAMNLHDIENRITEVEASYERQLALAGRNGYDPALTAFLKKDLDWLRDQKNSILGTPTLFGDNKVNHKEK